MTSGGFYQNKNDKTVSSFPEYCSIIPNVRLDYYLLFYNNINKNE